MPPRALPLAAVLVVFGIAAAACGGGSTEPGVANLGTSSTSTTTPAATNSSSQSGGGGASAGNSRSNVAVIGVGITLQFAQCMRTHGVPKFPDPNGQGEVQLSGISPQSATYQAARRACAKYSPNGGKPPSTAQRQQVIAQALKFSECMRSHGISDYPDPQVVAGGNAIRVGVGKSGSGDLDPNNPLFAAAQKACESLGLTPFAKGSAAGTGGPKG